MEHDDKETLVGTLSTRCTVLAREAILSIGGQVTGPVHGYDYDARARELDPQNEVTIQLMRSQARRIGLVCDYTYDPARYRLAAQQIGYRLAVEPQYLGAGYSREV